MFRKGPILWLALFLLIISGCFLQNLSFSQSPVTDDMASKALSYAIKKVGSPYLWGGRGPDAFDCSGLITWSYKQVKPDLEFRIGNQKVLDINMAEMWRYNILPISPENMLPGDIIFIADAEGKIIHGGMFIAWVDKDRLEMVNASSYHDSVVIATFPLKDSLREQHFAGAGRLQIISP